MIKQIENNKYSLESQNDYQLTQNRNPLHHAVLDNSLLKCLTQSKSKKGGDQTLMHRI